MSKLTLVVLAFMTGTACSAAVTWAVASERLSRGASAHTHATAGIDGAHDHRSVANLNDPELPDWARRAAQRHGGLGPWVISGAIAARHARSVLEPGTGEVLDVVYLVPDDRRVPGVMCVVDGLSVGSGIGGSDHEVRSVYVEALDPKYDPPAHAEPGVPTLFRVLDKDGVVIRAVRYTPSSSLLTVLHEGSLDSLAVDARSLIAMPVEDLFVIDEIASPVAANIP